MDISIILGEVANQLEQQEKDISLQVALFDIAEGPQKGMRAVIFVPKGYPQLEPYMLDSAPIIERIEDAKKLEPRQMAFELQRIINTITHQVTTNYLPEIKKIIFQNNLQKYEEEKHETVVFHDSFDYTMVDRILTYFRGQRNGVRNISSEKVGPDGKSYLIRAESTNGILLKIYYIRSGNNDRDVIQIESVYIPDELRGKGLSKELINWLMLNFNGPDAGHLTNKTDIYITDVINKDWENYLISKGAELTEKNDEKGDILLIPHFL